MRQASDDEERAQLFAALVAAARGRVREFGSHELWLDVNSPAPLRPRGEVREYMSTVELERDANHRIPLGWQLQAQSQEPGQTHRVKGAAAGAVVGSLVLMPFLGAVAGGLANSRDSGKITVTWPHPGTVA